MFFDVSVMFLSSLLKFLEYSPLKKMADLSMNDA